MILEVGRGDNARTVARNYAAKLRDIVVEVVEHQKKDGKTIGVFVDDIRELRELVRTAKKDTRTVVIIADAAMMTAGAQNALLKLLEEPRQGLYFILATPTPEKLFATIRSRCQLAKSSTKIVDSIPESKKRQAEFMAAGDLSELNRLISDSAYFDSQAKLFAEAKLFLGEGKYRRIAMISKTKDSRDDALNILRASAVLAGFMLRNHYSAAMSTQTTMILDAIKAIENNGNVRLWLLKTVI